MSCNKIYDKPQECTCGSKKFIYNSRKYKIEDGSIVCGCGKGNLESNIHYDCDDGFLEEFLCVKCKNRISIYEYFNEEDYTYDEEKIFKFLFKFDD